MTCPNMIGNIHKGNMGKQLRRFFFSGTAALVLSISYSVVDAVYIGRLGSEALAALYITLPAQMVFGAVAIGSGIGAAVLVNCALENGEYKEAGFAVGQVLLMTLLMGTLCYLIGKYHLEQLLIFCGATAQILSPAAEYMSVFTKGAAIHLASYIMAYTIRAEGNMTFPVAVMFVSSVANIVLNPIFMFTLDHGIKGAALSTEMSKAINVVCYLWYYLRRKGTLTIGISQLWPSLKIIRAIIKNGLPVTSIYAISNIALIFANKFIIEFGYAALAVMGIIMQLHQLAGAPLTGINQSLLPVIQHSFKIKRYSLIGNLMRKGLGAALLVSGLAGFAFFFLPELFLGIFTEEELILSEGYRALRIMAVLYPFISLPLLNISFLQGIGKTSRALMLSFMQHFLFIPLIVFMREPFGLTGIWAAKPLAALIAAAVSAGLLFRELKQHGISLFKRKYVRGNSYFARPGL